MRDYRLHCLDAAGRISFAEWIIARDDDEAIAKARGLKRDLRKCEVWHDNRLVASLDAQDLSAYRA